MLIFLDRFISVLLSKPYITKSELILNQFTFCDAYLYTVLNLLLISSNPYIALLFDMFLSLGDDCSHMIICQRIENGLSFTSALHQLILL